MAHVYAALIQKGAINPKTNEPYKIEDVPRLLRDAVELLLNPVEEF